ncbi:MAG: glycosyltransferase family 2 protein [Fidelibacterota bacterium]
MTIVTPSLNQDSSLERTILSVLNQHYPNLEYIVIDGGSTDNSVEIIRRYAPYLAYWVSEPDRGQAHAVNKGWEKSTGAIYAFLNADDAYLPGVLIKIADLFATRPNLGMVYGDSLFVDDQGHTLGIKRGCALTYKQLLFRGQSGIIQPTCFFRGSVVSKVGYLDESLFMGFDYDFILRVTQHTEILYLPAMLAVTTYNQKIKSFMYPERFHAENRKIASRYERHLFLCHRWNAAKFRLLRMLPTSLEHCFRRWRNSIEDRIILEKDP